MTLDNLERPKRSLAEKNRFTELTRLEILETNCTDNWPNAFALRSSKAIHLLPKEHGEIWGRLEVVWEEVACWSTKAAISLKRVTKDRGKVGIGPIGTRQRSFKRCHPQTP